jgi:hypothetical protein
MIFSKNSMKEKAYLEIRIMEIRILILDFGSWIFDYFTGRRSKIK